MISMICYGQAITQTCKCCPVQSTGKMWKRELLSILFPTNAYLVGVPVARVKVLSELALR